MFQRICVVLDCFLLLIFSVTGWFLLHFFFEEVSPMVTYNILIWHHKNCKVNLELRVSEKSFLPISLHGSRFQRNLFSFEKRKVVTEDFIWCQISVVTSYSCRFLPNCSRWELNELKMQLLDFRHYLVLGLGPWEKVFRV